MDPNEVLNNLRSAIRDYEKAVLPEDVHSAASDLADGFEALDRWILSGGFLPTEWTLAVRGIKR